MSAANVDVEFEIWPHVAHVRHTFSPMLGEGREAIAGATAWLNQRFGRRP